MPMQECLTLLVTLKRLEDRLRSEGSAQWDQSTGEKLGVNRDIWVCSEKGRSGEPAEAV